MEFLIGKALSPFFATLLVWLVARPLSNLVQRKMSNSWLKRLLLIHSERQRRAYSLGCLVVFGLAIIIASIH